VTNAFNWVGRKALAQQVARYFPEILPYNRMIYPRCRENQLLVTGWREDIDHWRHFTMHQGVRATHRLRYYMHSLFPLLYSPRRLFPDVTVLAFHDDISILAVYGGTPTRLGSAMESRPPEAVWCAQLQREKCTIWHHPEFTIELDQQPTLTSVARQTLGALWLHRHPQRSYRHIQLRSASKVSSA